ncbi:MAG: carbon-nitrogen hydrolase [Xanthomonadales bacterium]|nr:carbon-nitrogen hydrolase [Xanthomonadales bacterium]
MSATLDVALIQERDHGSREANLAAIAARLREAAGSGARLALLMELHNGPYFCQRERVEEFARAEPVPGPTTEFLAGLARELRMVIVGSVFERRGPGLHHNTAVVLDADGRLAGRYRKMHIPEDPGFHEKFYFAPGDLGFRPVDSAVGRLGVLVCWDQWFPEAARLMALAGAELLLYPTAIGWDPRDDEDERRRQREAWITVQRGHAIANGLPVLACNRVGHEPDPEGGPGILFWGSSFAAGPQGELLAVADADRPATLTVRLDLRRGEAVRRIWPFLRDRRIDAYGELLARWRDG